MFDIDEFTLPAFKYLVAESDSICRLCFTATDATVSGVCLDDRRRIQRQYYNDTISFADMLTHLGASSEPDLPQMLCEYCADTTIRSFLFQKMCQHSYNKWNDIIEKLAKTLDLSDTIRPTVKSAYMIINDDNNLMLTCRNHQVKNNKELVLKRVRALMKDQKTKITRTARRNARKNIFICEECGREFNYRQHFKYHIRSFHSKIKHQCRECSKLFSNQTLLDAHFERVHKPKTIPCPKCPKMLSSATLLKYHDAIHHRAVKCKHCFIQFPSKQDLRIHVDSININKCPRCNKEIRSKSRFNKHIKICGIEAENQLNFFCDICDKGYGVKSSLAAHIKGYHGFGPSHHCEWCNKPFHCLSSLKDHIVKHTRERNFHCDKCGGKFVTKPALTYHLRIHTGEKPYPCDMCDESFLSTSRRMLHMRRKHWAPTKECPVCGKKFVTSNDLRKHVKKHANPKSRLYVARSMH